jgi:hypothetical protein
MKMLMILYTGPESGRIPALLDAEGVHGWTELSHAHGSGATGRHAASRVFPGESTVFLTVVPTDDVPRLDGAFRRYAATAEPSERLHVAVIPIECFC